MEYGFIWQPLNLYFHNKSEGYESKDLIFITDLKVMSLQTNHKDILSTRTLAYTQFLFQKHKSALS